MEITDSQYETIQKMRDAFTPNSIIAQEFDSKFNSSIRCPDKLVKVHPFIQFQDYMRKFPLADVLELGTYQSIPGRSTMQKYLVPSYKSWKGTDIKPGADVDFVSDVHRLSHFAGKESYDAIIACSVMEHVKYPHLAAHEIMKTLKIGGALAIQTHFTFVEHAYPYDYFRYTREGLAGLFGTKNGFKVVSVEYEFPCRISSVTGDGAGVSYLNVCLFGVKESATPDQFIYEWDTAL